MIKRGKQMEGIQEDYEPEAMDEFVVGYPWGYRLLEEEGSQYTKEVVSLLIHFRRLPSVRRTTSAMSGSPVIASRAGIHMPDGKMSGNTVTVSKFLGVYSGRLLGDDSVERLESISWSLLPSTVS